MWLVEDTRGTRTRVCLRCREVEIARLRAAATHGSKRATAAFVVSLVFCLTPLAWAALPLGLLELRAIRRGDAPRAGRPWAAAGAAAGALSLLLWVFYAFAFARFR